jgi:hypothetical protein
VGRIKAINGELWAVSQSLIVASGVLLHWALQYLITRGTAMEKNNQNNPKKHTNKQQLFLESKNGKITSNGKPSTPGLMKVTATEEKAMPP